MKKIISDLIYKNMVRALSKTLSKGNIPLPDGKEPIAADDGADLNIIAFGDPQISALSPLRSARVFSAMRDIEQARGSFDALIVAGDIAEYGAWCEYKMMTRLIAPVKDKFSKIFIITGNHDVRIRSFKKQLKKFNRFLGLTDNAQQHGEEKYYFARELKGYKFIVLGADTNAFEDSYISDAQLDWLETELDKNETGKPVFVINHQPLKNTNGLPDSWLGKGDFRGSVGPQSDRLKEIFERHSGIIYVTGHLHYGVSAYNLEDYGSYKCLSLPTVGVLNHGKNDKLAQGYVLTVRGNTVTARGRCFCEGRYFGDDIENSRIEINC